MVKAVVLGAAGGIGQPLSLLLKINTHVTELALYDIVNTPGVAADLSHIATPAKVSGYLPKTDTDMELTLKGAHIVVIPAGVPRKPGVNPVNSTVPIVAEVFKKAGVYDPKRIFGVTTLDVVRASTFVAEALDDLSLSTSTSVPVVGGHSGVTIIPLLSQTEPPLPSSIDQKTLEELTHRVQFGGDEVVKAKDGAGSATLSMAQAGYLFATHIIDAAINGKKDVIVPTYVALIADPEGGNAVKKELGTDLEYFSARVTLGPNGVEKIHPLGTMSDYEKRLIKAAIPELEGNITNGTSFIANADPSKL
ncbi:hypothetical protein FRB94_006718 [Tulasnella sp. JGI-2019a]|nr:hypothetical protein FRB94_006718 [Tulasnella sp. JGI-2019a]